MGGGPYGGVRDRSIDATRAAKRGGPYGGDWNVSIVDGRVAGDGDPYGGFRKPVARRRGRVGGEYKECGKAANLFPAAVGDGPYGVIRNVSIIERRVAGDGDPYGG